MFMPQDGSRIELLHLRRNARVQEVEADGRLYLACGEGGGVLCAKGTAMAALMPVRGSLRVHTTSIELELHVGWALFTEADPGLRVVAQPNSRWLGVMGCKGTWDWLMAGALPPPARILPAMRAVDREFRRKMMTFARHDWSGELEGVLRSLACDIATLQHPLYAVIKRCPGRTFASKLQVFLRLQRVRRFMNAYCERELDNETLARVANYSPCHFLRTFREVYQETPHAYLVRQRLRRADQLLRWGDLAVGEVALASGFENRSAFSRRYHQQFGVTASQARRPGVKRRTGRLTA